MAIGYVSTFFFISRLKREKNRFSKQLKMLNGGKMHHIWFSSKKKLK